MKTNHTAGQWHADNKTGLVYWESEDGQKSKCIANFDSYTPTSQCVFSNNETEIEANGKLIANSPAMLKALQNFVDTIDEVCKLLPDTNERKIVYTDIKLSDMYKEAKKAITNAVYTANFPLK